MTRDSAAGGDTGRTGKLARGAILLWAILLGTLAFRLNGVAFGLPALNDPDELMFELGAVRMLSGHTLNPGWFGHPGTTTIYLLALIDIAVFGFGWLLGWFPDPKVFANVIYADPSWVILPGRVAMALFSVLCVWLTYRLARELFGQRAGLAAAAFLAVDPVHVVWSQVIRTDIMASCFMLLCMLSSVRLAREGLRRDLAMAALWLALAVATKWPFAIAALSVGGALVLRGISSGAGLRREAARFALFGGLSVALLVLISPYLLLDFQTVLKNLQGEAQTQHLGATGGGLFWNAGWYLGGPLLRGLGFGASVLAIAGVAMLPRRREAFAVIGPVLIAFFAIICVQHLVWDRWALPLLPLLCILAAYAFVEIARRGASWMPSKARAVAFWAALAAILVQPAYATVQAGRERKHDTRQIATEWMKAHAPPGATIMVEHFGFDLLSGPWRLMFPLGTRGCIDARDILHNKVQYHSIEGARTGISNVDYGTMEPSMRGSCRIDFAILTQYDRYRVEKERFRAEFAAYSSLLTKGRVVATIAPREGAVGGPIVRIVAFPSSAGAGRH